MMIPLEITMKSMVLTRNENTRERKKERKWKTRKDLKKLLLILFQEREKISGRRIRKENENYLSFSYTSYGFFSLLFSYLSGSLSRCLGSIVRHE